MPSLQECAAQLQQLATQLPFGAAQHIETELESIVQQAHQVVQGTGHEQVIGQLQTMQQQMIQQLADQLRMMQDQLQKIAAAVVAGH